MQCCNSCAFLKCNANKPNPSPEDINKPEKSDTEWYSQQNLDEKWEATKTTGMFLTCHSTDPTYYAKDGSKLTACVGFTFCVFMHIKIYELLDCNFRLYRNAVGHKIAMTKKAMAEAAISMTMGCGDLIGKFKIPREISEDRPGRYPTGFEKTIATFEKLSNYSVNK